jgi:hypothetical protein
VLATDVRLALLLLSEARYRALGRVFGTSREQANLITFVLVLAVADGGFEVYRRAMRGPPVPPLGDGALAAASVRELFSSAAGLPPGDSSQLGTLLTLAFAGGLLGPTVVRSVRDAKSTSQRLDRAFRHRYGYLIDPGHWRRRRYELQERLRSQAGQPG